MRQVCKQTFMETKHHRLLSAQLAKRWIVISVRRKLFRRITIANWCMRKRLIVWLQVLCLRSPHFINVTKWQPALSTGMSAKHLEAGKVVKWVDDCHRQATYRGRVTELDIQANDCQSIFLNQLAMGRNNKLLKDPAQWVLLTLHAGNRHRQRR